MDMFAIALIAATGSISLFSFLAVATWSDSRRREREAFYRTEVLKKLSENPSAENQPILQMLRDDQDKKARSRMEGLKLGGFITSVVGIGLAVFLHAVDDSEQVWTVGIIPLLIGLTLLFYAFFLAPKPAPPRA